MNRALSGRLPQAVLLSLLAAPLASAESAEAPSTRGMTIAVTNCNDSGAGSLRDAVARALSGDTIDMRKLACNAITLSSGAIAIPQQDLGIQGPGRDRLTINGSGDRVFDHQGGGLLQLKKLSIANGSGNAGGGCVYARGRVELRNVRVHHCIAGDTEDSIDFPASPYAAGGGLSALGDVSLYDSVVDYNKALPWLSDSYTEAYGGGVYAGGKLIIERSRISNNATESRGGRYEPGLGGGAYAAGGVTANHASILDNKGDYGGGGLHVSGSATILNSIIARNTSDGSPGGISASGGPVIILNSTLSGNIGSLYFGLDSVFPAGSVLQVRNATTTIANSTIAFNRNLASNNASCGGAIQTGSDSLLIESTIVADNLCDYGSDKVESLDIRAADIQGGRNLIQKATSPLPADTIVADPQLAPLAANGGLTDTHALPATSPAIDTGANPYDLAYDQRGPGFPRVNGAQADIGAYER